MKKHFKLRPGLYYLGDPSLLFHDDDWFPIIDETNSFITYQLFTWETGSICAYPIRQAEQSFITTQCTKGSLTIHVKSGLLGVSNVSEMPYEDQDFIDQMNQTGFFVLFDKPFIVTFEEHDDRVTHTLGDLVFTSSRQVDK